jgi:hypothetical protein
MPPRRRTRHGPVPLRTRVPQPSSRHNIVKQVMKTHNLSMIDASKHVKKHKLYTGGKLPMQYVKTRGSGFLTSMFMPRNIQKTAQKAAQGIVSKAQSTADWALANPVEASKNAFNISRMISAVADPNNYVK